MPWEALRWNKRIRALFSMFIAKGSRKMRLPFFCRDPPATALSIPLLLLLVIILLLILLLLLLRLQLFQRVLFPLLLLSFLLLKESPQQKTMLGGFHILIQSRRTLFQV